MKNLIFEPPDVFVMVGEEKHHIGEIHHGTLIVTRHPEKHMMKKWNAYGVNAEIIDSGLIKMFIVESNRKQLLISVEDVKAFGRLHQEEGWDKQYFVPIDQFTQI